MTGGEEEVDCGAEESPYPEANLESGALHQVRLRVAV